MPCIRPRVLRYDVLGPYVGLSRSQIYALSKGGDFPGPIKLTDGSIITVEGNEVVRKTADGQMVPFEVAEGREIVANKNIVIPPFGTTQRKYSGVLGTNRLNMGDGYALHGTDVPCRA